MVLMNEPRMLLLDEPTAGVNPSAIDALIDCLRRVRDELATTLLVIEHNMPVIMGLADRMYCLSRGQVLAEGEPAAIRKDQRVIDAYLGAG
jgi:branched-chain amino acid transport system ATP-binding protein